MKISKIWIYIGLVFLAATILLIFNILGSAEWVSSVLGTNFLGLIRDGVKDDNSALKQYVEKKNAEVKNLSDDDFAAQLDRVQSRK